MNPVLTSSHTLWTAFRTVMMAMSSATCYTTGEKARLSGIYDQSLTASGTFIRRDDLNYVWAKFISGLNARQH